MRSQTRVAPDDWRECPVCQVMLAHGWKLSPKYLEVAVDETESHPDHSDLGWEAAELAASLR